MSILRTISYNDSREIKVKNIKDRVLMSRIFLAMVILAVSGCIPAHLQKYRKGGGLATDPAITSPSSQELVGSSFTETDLDDTPTRAYRSKPSSKKTTGASIYAIDEHTYRFRIREQDVWEAVLSVLMKNYNLTIVDRRNGVVTTEWDSYYLNNYVFRNKVSIRLRKNSYNVVDLMIHNNVEKLRDATQAAGTMGAVWLPAKDEAKEVGRILQNMSLVLNQPPPIMPPGTDVASGEKSDTGVER